jgi:hypothetical protein
VAATLGSRPLFITGKSNIDDRIFTTVYEGFQIGKSIATKRGLLDFDYLIKNRFFYFS